MIIRTGSDHINFRRLGKDDITIEKMKKDFDAGYLFLDIW